MAASYVELHQAQSPAPYQDLYSTITLKSLALIPYSLELFLVPFKVELFDQEPAALFQTNYPTPMLQVHHQAWVAIASLNEDQIVSKT